MANPFDLEVANKALQRSFVGKQVYSRVMGSTFRQRGVTFTLCRVSNRQTGNMKKLITTHKDAVLKHTNLDFDNIQKVTYLHEFDREVQYVHHNSR